MPTPPFVGTGIPWYRRNDYPGILHVMVDREKLSPTFDEWEKRSKYAERERASLGPVYRVEIRPEQFVAWCAERGLDVDANARMAFASDPANWSVRHKH